MIEGMIKHTGILTNTGKNVVVVFMSLPNDEDHCLVVDTDALPDSFNHSLRKVVESVEAQQVKDLADILSRTMSPDGSNTTLLQKFHMSQRLQKVPVDIVTMTPKRGVNWPLRDILNAMKQVKDNQQAEIADLSDLDPETRAQVSAEIGKFNVHQQNMDGQSAEASADQARGLIAAAEMLEADAMAKRAQAYRLNPGLLKPKAKMVVKAAEPPPMIDTSMPVVSKPKAPPRRRAK
jgi:hypothetical protein